MEKGDPQPHVQDLRYEKQSALYMQDTQLAFSEHEKKAHEALWELEQDRQEMFWEQDEKTQEV